MKYRTEKYIAIKDHVILRVMQTSDGIDGVKKALGNMEYDTIEKVPLDSSLQKNRDRREYDDKTYDLRPLSERVASGYVELPTGHKLSGDVVVPMTLEEKVAVGIEPPQPRMKAVGDEWVKMTDAEIIASGQATQKELDDERSAKEREVLIQAEIRKMAEERLIAEGKIRG